MVTVQEDQRVRRLVAYVVTAGPASRAATEPVSCRSSLSGRAAA